jgi:hypothetical protein
MRLPLPLVGLLLGVAWGMLLAGGAVLGGATFDGSMLGIVGMFAAFGLFVGVT